MKFPKHILALLLAILVANPLCCCFAQSAVSAEEKAPSCCSRNTPADNEAPAGDTCPGCQVKNPRVADGGKTLPITVEFFELPLFASELADSRPSVRDFDSPTFLDIAAPPPPRLVLALQQRFLI